MVATDTVGITISGNNSFGVLLYATRPAIHIIAVKI
jgi:hypothetical protein